MSARLRSSAAAMVFPPACETGREVMVRDRVPAAQATGEELYKSKSIPIPLTTWFSQRGREGSELVRERTDGKKEKSTVTHVNRVVTGVTHDT